eukprot:8669292-Pyramimonas_sp.AAC.1
MGTRCSLAAFTRTSFCALEWDDSYLSGSAPRDPWPCPPSPPLPPPPGHLTGRARERWRVRRAAR